MRLRTRPSFWRAGRGSGSSTASRAGKAKKRGLSREQVPILVAADRGGETLSHTLPALNADNVKEVLEPVLAPDALLVSDANRCYPPVAAALDIPHESINASAGERVRGAVHIQTVNSRHSQIKGILRRRRGIATKYLDSYLRGSVASLAKGRCVIGGLPVHLMILRWPDGPVAMPWPRSGRTVRDRRRARRSGPRRQCRPGGRTSRPGPCAARASPRSP